MKKLTELIDKLCNLKLSYTDFEFQNNSSLTPLDSFKFCPKCGKKSITRNDVKSIKCISCNFLIFTNPATAVCGIIIHNNRILFTKRNKEPHINKLDLPGGFVDPNETAELALYRELKEELNIEVIKHKYITSIPNTYFFNDITYNTLDMFFLCEVKSKEDITFDNEIADYTFLQLNEINISNDIGLQSIKNFLNLLDNESNKS